MPQWISETVSAVTHFLSGLMGHRERRAASSLQVTQTRVVASLLVVPLSSSADPFVVSAEDVEEHGFFVRTPRPPLSYGEPVLVRVCTNASEDALWVRGEVVHVVEGTGFGCRFNMAQDDAQELAQIVRESRLHMNVRKRRVRHRTIMIGS